MKLRTTRRVVWLVLIFTIQWASSPGPSRAATQSLKIELVGEGIISTNTNQTFPAQDPNSGTLWFSEYERSFGSQTIKYSKSTEAGWTAPEVASFSGEWNDRAPRFSVDGTTLFFSSARPVSPGSSASDMNIWSVERVGDSWGTPELVRSDLNSDGNDIHSSSTNRAIYVASNREGGLGRSDIYRVGSSGKAEHLSAPINDENSQPDLFVSPDESWMILVITAHPDGYGGDDLYVSRSVGDAWSNPQNLGPEINSDEYEYGPTLSADGAYLYFTSHRGDSANIYRVMLSSVLELGSR